MESSKLKDIIVEILDKNKAEDVVAIDVSQKVSYADYFIIASGTSERHIKALTDFVEEKLKENDIEAKAPEGRNGGNWILMDLNDIIVHLMTKEAREFYSLEELY